MLFSDEEAVPGAEGPLVTVTFQRTPHKKQKYLESQPKALGVNHPEQINEVWSVYSGNQFKGHYNVL